MLRHETLIVIALMFVLPAALAGELEQFNTHFKDRTLRVDYYHTGDADVEWVAIDRLYEQGIWAGSRRHLIDSFDLGQYYVKVYDVDSEILLFSKGFDSYFAEYRTTSPAAEGIKRTYHETALIPFPRHPVRFVLEGRSNGAGLTEIFSQVIKPDDYRIAREGLTGWVKVTELVKSGDPHGKVDVAIIAEGYTVDDEEKFADDLKRFAEIFFKYEPYASRRSAFNLYGVFKPSQESGCDEPSHGVFKNTAVGTAFDSLGSERYLLTEDNRALRDIAAHVPYDALYIMINHSRYGGGGIYNLYCTFTSDNQWQEYLFVHEFGHAFGGLADEYYTSSVAYTDLHPPDREPSEPNITALLEPSKLKWGDLVTPGTQVPTPWEKEGFDAMQLEYKAERESINMEIARLKREGAPGSEVGSVMGKSERMSRKNARRTERYLGKSEFVDQVGAFEGAGYESKGLYRPMLDCVMFTRGAKPFCKVCQRALERVIDHYGE